MKMAAVILNYVRKATILTVVDHEGSESGPEQYNDASVNVCI